MPIPTATEMIQAVAHREAWTQDTTLNVVGWFLNKITDADTNPLIASRLRMDLACHLQTHSTIPESLDDELVGEILPHLVRLREECNLSNANIIERLDLVEDLLERT